MRLSELRNAKIKSLDGQALGRVHEVHADGGRIIALACGAGGWIERLTGRRKGRRVPWECVVRIGKGVVLVMPEQARKKA